MNNLVSGFSHVICRSSSIALAYTAAGICWVGKADGRRGPTYRSLSAIMSYGMEHELCNGYIP
jgi:hypothetical protein